MKLIGFDILKQDEKLGWNSRAKHVDLKAPPSDFWGKQTNTLETHCNVTDQVGVFKGLTYSVEKTMWLDILMSGWHKV